VAKIFHSLTYYDERICDQKGVHTGLKGGSKENGQSRCRLRPYSECIHEASGFRKLAPPVDAYLNLSYTDMKFPSP
jgi:hypothetical protein